MNKLAALCLTFPGFLAILHLAIALKLHQHLTLHLLDTILR